MLAGNGVNLLRRSDEDNQVCDKEAMMLGTPLEAANHLYYDLQMTYKHAQ